MLFTARPHPFSYRVLAVLVVAGSLASGCQSTRPGFSFRPGPERMRTVKEPKVTAAAPVTAPEPAVLPAAVTQAKPAACPPTSPSVTRQQRARFGLAGVFAEKGVSRPAMRPAAPHRRVLLARPHATAEAGLGTTVLGILGLVVLPVALVGLLLSGGGLVWGIVAGAAALAALVAYLDPNGR